MDMPEQQVDNDQQLHTDRRPRRSYTTKVHRNGFTLTRSTAILLIALLLIVVLGALASVTFPGNFSDSSKLSNADEVLMIFFACLTLILSLVFILVGYFKGKSKTTKQSASVFSGEASDARSRLAYYSDLQKKALDNSIILGIRILEDPLTAQNVTTLLSAFAEFYVKCWLIAKRRFADLIEYTQTHNVQISNEVGLIISKISYNSPFNIDWKVDASVQGLAEAVATTIDSVTQVRQRLEKAELENRQKEQEIKLTTQKADQEFQIAQLENEKAALEIEKQRLELLEKRLDVQKKGIEYAFEIAGKTVDTLHPDADSETRAMIIQTLLLTVNRNRNSN
jgi:hypothetical protein